MTPQQIDRVQDSFKSVKALGSKAGELFYARLFELDPSLRRLFGTDIPAQSVKLMQMIAVAVHGLQEPEALLPAVRDLGARHHGYGVEPSHYPTVGTALLDTLALGLGTAFTPAIREAWTACYMLIAGEMQAGAEQASAAPTRAAG